MIGSVEPHQRVVKTSHVDNAIQVTYTQQPSEGDEGHELGTAHMPHCPTHLFTDLHWMKIGM